MFSQFAFALQIQIKQTVPLLIHMRCSVLIELTLRHLRCHLTDVPAQPNTQIDNVAEKVKHHMWHHYCKTMSHTSSKNTDK